MTDTVELENVLAKAKERLQRHLDCLKWAYIRKFRTKLSLKLAKLWR